MPAGSVSRLLLDALSIVLIDLVLAGDNALVIAMAVRSLPEKQRRIATAFGSLAAVALRIGITIVAARLLNIEFLKAIGGVLVIWIAVKVLADAGSEAPEGETRNNLLKAIWLIVFADITMSIDNVLAVAGAARGNVPMIIFGLGVSIPFVVLASNLIAKLMDRYPVVIYLGAAILGKVGAEMTLTDPFITRMLHPSETMIYVAQGIAIVAVIAIGRSICRRSKARQKRV